MSFGPVSTKLFFYDEQNRFFISSIGYELSITQNIIFTNITLTATQ